MTEDTACGEVAERIKREEEFNELLAAEYAGKWVARHGYEVWDSDSQLDALCDRVEASGVKDDVMVFRVGTRAKVRSGDWGRPEGFGARVRAARGFAGISQARLADLLAESEPFRGCSISTVKRLEYEDQSVRGYLREWSQAVSLATGAPEWFLVEGWDGHAVRTDMSIDEIVAALEKMGVAKRIEPDIDGGQS